MPNFTPALSFICCLLMCLVLGQVVKYTAFTVLPDKFLPLKSHGSVDTLTTCAAQDYIANG